MILMMNKLKDILHYVIKHSLVGYLMMLNNKIMDVFTEKKFKVKQILICKIRNSKNFNNNCKL